MLIAFEMNNNEWMKPYFVLVTTGNSMKHIPSWEDGSYWVLQEFSSILCNLMVINSEICFS